MKNSENSSENNGSEDGNKSESQANNMQKVRANCKTEELSKLKAKCEYLVRSCIGGLILTMTEQNFIEMEGNFYMQNIKCQIYRHLKELNTTFKIIDFAY